MKLYLLINNNLDLAYQGVQAGHGVAQWLLDNPEQTWNNQILVYLDCPNLKQWEYKLQQRGLVYSKFYEPDINNELTVIALLSDGKLFKNLKLMGK